ncbi:MAG: hypothetical protein AAB414_00520 [Patescibacteria group bacterium]
MKVLLFGKNSQDIKGIVENQGFEIVTSDAEVVISFGGDGTLLSSEREYPSVPKLPIRNSQFCNKCSNHEDKKVLKDLLENKLILKEYSKLHTKFVDQDFYALNDFIIRNQHPIHTIRFMVTTDHSKRSEGPLLIGDGIVLSTPFGSTGYFKSVTGESFSEGFGLAFNNTTEKTRPIYLNEKDSVEFKLVRGHANLSFDNNPDIFNISEGTVVTFDLSEKFAKIYESSLRCPNCQIIRG